MRPLPTLFVSHGAPTLAMDPGQTGARLAQLGERMPRPRAVLVVSAHWETAAPSVSAAARPDTIHDFHGFPPALYSIRYGASGAPDLAERVRGCLAAAGFDTGIDPTRGLDHGAWVPLLHLFPDAGVPVTQLSVQTHLGPDHHWALGEALAPLAHEGVLIMGSGSITHNLAEFRMLPEDTGEAPYVNAFRTWMADRIAARDYAALRAYRTQAPHAARAHPTEEHLLPLHVALGAASVAPRHERLHAGVTFGVVGMDAYVFGADRLDAGQDV
ncbi:MAG: dioxygenase [Betaproteobacteria bacterium]|nr:dioxygenase [Betaproteobacteria bacterium]